MQYKQQPLDRTSATFWVDSGFEWEIFQLLDVGIALCSPDGRTLYVVNPAFAAIYRSTIAELTGKPLLDLIPSDGHASWSEELQRGLELANYTFAAQHCRPDGQCFPVSVKLKTIKDESGNRVYGLLIVEEMKQPQPTNQAQWDNNAGVQLLFETHPQPIAIYDSKNLQFLSVNPAAIAYYGYSEAEFLSKTVWDILSQETQDPISHLPSPKVCKHRLQDGREMQVETTTHSLTFKSRPAQLLLVQHSDRNFPRETAAQESEAHSALRVEGDTDPICRFLSDGTLTWVNKSYCRYFRKHPEELIKQNFVSIISEEDRERVKQHLASLTAANPANTCEHSVVFPNGETRRQQWLYQGIFDERDRIVEFHFRGQDLTEEKLIAEGLPQIDRQLAVVDNGLEQIVGNLPGCVFRYVHHTNGRRSLPYMSEKWREITGQDPHEVRRDPQRLFEMIHSEDKAQFEKQMTAALETLEPFDLEFRIRPKSGPVKWIRKSARLSKNCQGDVAIDAMILDISEQKQTEEALDRQEREFTAILEQSPDLIVRCDRQLRYVYVNPAIVQATGIPASTFREKTARELHLPVELITKWEKACQNVFETSQQQWIEWEWSISREVRQYHTYLAPEFAEDGSVEFVLSVSRDITQRRQIEAALQKRETELQQVRSALQTLNEQLEYRVIDRTEDLIRAHERLMSETQERWKLWQQYSTVVDNLKEVVFQTNEAGIFSLLNPAWTEITGFSTEESLGKHFVDYVHPEDIAYNREQLQLLLQGNQEYCGHQSRFLTKKGEFCWIEIFSQPLPDAGGKILGIAGTLNDITERKHAEDALRESEDRFRSFFEQAAVGLAQMGLNGEWFLVNQKLCSILGYSREELLGHRCQDVTYPEDLPATEKDLRSLQSGKQQTRSFEKRYRRKDESPIWVNVTTSVALNSSSEPKYFIKVVEDITPRKHAEERLRKSEANLAEAQKLAHLGSWEFDLSTQVLTWSEETFRIFGFDPTQKEPTFAEVLEKIYPDDRKYWQKLYRKREITANEEYEVEFRILRPQGAIAHISTRQQTVTNACGQVVRLFGTVQDITEHKQAEEVKTRLIASLQESEERFRLLADTAPVMIWMADIQGRYCFFNKPWLDFRGRSFEEEVGKGWEIGIHPEDTDRCLSTYVSAFKARESFQLEYRLCRADGEYRWMLDTGIPRFTSSGEFSGYIGSAIDISDRKRTESIIKATQERFEYLLASNPAVIYTCPLNSDLPCTFISANVKENLGYTVGEWLSNPKFWVARIHPEDAPHFVTNFSRLIEKGHQIFEYRFLHEDGTYRWLRDEIKVVRDCEGNGVECIGSIIDISDRKRAEEEVFKALEKERELVELKSRFVSMTSHEFRTPLTTILSSAQLIQRYQWTREEQLEILEQIIGAVKHMNELLEDILSIGKAESGQMQFKPVPLELTQFCRTLLLDIQRSSGSKHTIHFVVEPGFTDDLESPLTTRQIHARMDEKLLRKMLGNLLSNAIKYSQNEEGDIIQFTLNCHLDCAIFQIQDRGIGIPPEDQSRLFESFHRARNVGTIPGTGLGLAIVKKCVELHGGTITFNTQVGVGTTFILTLPLQSQGQSQTDEENSGY